ncbi:phosphate ABC transporter permease subunit PstC [soil metagenome]
MSVRPQPGNGFSAAEVRGRLRAGTTWGLRTKEKVIELLLMGCGLASIIAVSLIFIFLFKEGIGAFRLAESPKDFLYAETVQYKYDAATETSVAGPVQKSLTWQPVGDKPKLSIAPLVWGSLGIAAISAVVSTLAGIAVGIFLSEMSGARLRNYVKPALELLVGIPTVVIGFFMLTIMAIPLKRLLNPAEGGGILPAYADTYNMFVGALGVSIVIIPVIASMVDDAMRAVPQDLRAGSLCLGATRWQTTWRVVLPAGFSGVIAAVILGFGRALGETMIVLMCAGGAAQITGNPFASVRTMTAAIAAEMGSAQQGGLHAKTLFLIGAILVTASFFLNLVVEIIANKYRRRIRL